MLVSSASNASAPSQHSQIPPRLVTVRDAAHYLGLSYWTVRRMVNTGVLPKVVIPGCRRLLIDQRDLDRALEAWKERGEHPILVTGR